VNGSRTILHFRGDLPELNAKDFIDCFPSLDSFSWFHFEGLFLIALLLERFFFIKENVPNKLFGP
jgi:hypothetical protein